MIPELNNMQFKHSPYIPFDPTVTPLYSNYVSHAGMGGLQPFVYTNWRDEELSWHNNCYIHAGLNPMPMVWLKGPEALKCLSENFTNSFKKFEIGSIKHGIMVNPLGELLSDGLILRMGEDEFMTTCVNGTLLYRLACKSYNMEYRDVSGEYFVFQLGGPKSLAVVEAATGQDFKHLKFLRSGESCINGMKVSIHRIGMAGSLAYEVWGEFKDAVPVYMALLEAGKPFEITRLGRHAYWNTHTENGFPQNVIHFFGAVEHEPDYFEFLKSIPGTAMLCGSLSALTGSCGPDSLEERFVNPYELGWGRAVSFDHDFVGKEALQKIKETGHRIMVTLEWNADDICDIWKSGLTEEEPYAPMDGPEDMLENGAWEYRADKVVDGNKTIGISTGRIHSWYYKKMISLCVIDPEYAKPGQEVTVIWGNPEQRQKEIRAVVARYPYMDEDRNETVDVKKLFDR